MKEHLLYHTVSNHNILPLTSRCPAGCLFCSHRYNPPGVRTGFYGVLNIEVVRDLLDLLDGAKKIVIGESATLLCEGEPLSHPQFREIVTLLRRRFSAPIQVTTSGIGLDTALIRHLADLGGLELVVSLNSASPKGREKLMGPGAAGCLPVIAGLNKGGLVWHASIVLMPHIVGWDDVEGTLAFANAAGARSIRVMVPGFSRLAGVDKGTLDSIAWTARQKLGQWRQQWPLPITLEPALPRDLKATVAGILAGTPAEGVLRAGDVIVTINGQAPFSRVEAFDMLHRWANPNLMVQRGAHQLGLTLTKGQHTVPGVVMDWDLAPADLERALAMAGGEEAVLLLTSAWAAPLWQQVVPQTWAVRAVASRFFGGNIAAAGLLTLSDYQAALTGVDLSKFSRILLPPASFDHQGRDITGNNCQELAARLTVPLVWA